MTMEIREIAAPSADGQQRYRFGNLGLSCYRLQMAPESVLIVFLSLLASSEAFIQSQCRSSSSNSNGCFSFDATQRPWQGRPFGCTASSTSLHALPWFTSKKSFISTERETLKLQLLDACRDKQTSREQIEAIIDQLAPLSPSKSPAGSKQLTKLWNLLWTTEKEINAFVDWGIATKVIQVVRLTSLDNSIAFKNGGSLIVAGSVAANSANPQRTDFEFTAATLDLGVSFVPPLNLPPVGKGWFDTIYLDDELRIDTNSRSDILICLAD